MIIRNRSCFYKSSMCCVLGTGLSTSHAPPYWILTAILWGRHHYQLCRDAEVTLARCTSRKFPFESRQPHARVYILNAPIGWIWKFQLWLGSLGGSLWKEATESIGYSLFVWFSMFSDFVEPVQCQHEWHLICFYVFLFTKYNLKSLKRRIKWNSIFWNHRPTTYFFCRELLNMCCFHAEW